MGVTERCPGCGALCLRQGELLVSACHAYPVSVPDDQGGWKRELGRPVHRCPVKPERLRVPGDVHFDTGPVDLVRSDGSLSRGRQ